MLKRPGAGNASHRTVCRKVDCGEFYPSVGAFGISGSGAPSGWGSTQAVQ